MLPLAPPLAPMLARLERELPAADDDAAWAYEPKWDGFRCLLFRDGARVALQSRNQRDLARYFPELVAAAAGLHREAVFDGEILVATGAGYDFAALLERIHPAASRVSALAADRPAVFVAFDCLAMDGADLTAAPYDRRRELLADLIDQTSARMRLTPMTTDAEQARRWLTEPGPGWDGVVAKRRDAPYVFGKRAMVKVKPERTADCVVAGVRPGARGLVSSLLLGVWTPDGTLHHPGVVSSPSATVRREVEAELPRLALPLADHPWRAGFGLEGGATGRLKGAGSRWTPDLSLDWIPIAPELVAEVAYDRLDGLRFRHPAKFRRWRPDRDAASCGVEQLLAGS